MHERWYGGWLRFRVLTVIGYLAVVLPSLLGADSPDFWLAAISALVLPFVYGAVLRFADRREWNRLVARSTPFGDSLFVHLPGRALRDSGVHHIELRMDDGRTPRGARALRAGSQGLVVLPSRWDRLSPGALRGLLLHEAGHLVRNDSDRQRWLAGLGISAVLTTTTADVSGWVTAGAVVGLVIALLTNNWWREFAADGFVRRHGDRTTRAGFAQYSISAQRRPWQQASGWLTHPPDRWRVAREPSGHDPAAQHGALG